MTARQHSPETLDQTFAILEGYAIRGERCPENGTNGIEPGVIPALARAGRLRIEISGHNFRRVTLPTGAHAGAATASDPTGAQPWKTIDHCGTFTRGKLVSADAASLRKAPSAPRPLSREEILR